MDAVARIDPNHLRAHHRHRTWPRRLRGWLAVGCVLVGVACSSDSGDAADGEPGTPAAAEQDAGGDPGRGDGDAGSSSDVDEDPVCDVIDPVVDEMVTAAALDVPLTDDSPAGWSAAGCELRFTGPEARVTVTIGRVPAVISAVDTMASTFSEVEPVGPVPSLGDDARLLTDEMDGSPAYVLFSSNGRIWQVTAAGSGAGTIDASGADLAEVAISVAEVLRAGLEA